MFFSNAEVPLSDTDKVERRLRADLAASFQARILLWAFPTIINQETILQFASLYFVIWTSHFFALLLYCGFTRSIREVLMNLLGLHTEGGCTSPRGQMSQSFGVGAQDWSFSSLSCEQLILICCFELYDRQMSLSGIRFPRKEISMTLCKLVVQNLQASCLYLLQVVSGGVASNQVVRSRLNYIAHEVGLRLVCPPPRLCTDNGIFYFLL